MCLSSTIDKNHRMTNLKVMIVFDRDKEGRETRNTCDLEDSLEVGDLTSFCTHIHILVSRQYEVSPKISNSRRAEENTGTSTIPGEVRG